MNCQFLNQKPHNNPARRSGISQYPVSDYRLVEKKNTIAGIYMVLLHACSCTNSGDGLSSIKTTKSTMKPV